MQTDNIIYKSLKFESIFTENGWLEPGFLNQCRSGKTVSITNEEPAGIKSQKMQGWLLPGLINSHSHSFQFAMAGKCEHPHPNREDNFWSWRRSMYHLAQRLTPDQCQAIAAKLFLELVKNGFTDVVEFHYLYRDPKGNIYETPHELAMQIANAGAQVGINLHLTPVYYNQGNFDEPIQPEQKRFYYHSVDEYVELIELLRKEAHRGLKIGRGLHSLRAAPQDSIRQLLNDPGEFPIHLHISEQKKEVEQCTTAWGTAPLSWLFDNVKVDSRFNLVHATHISSQELIKVSQSESNVVLCPSTEGNLGDGFFPIEQYQGTWSIGTDSHVGLEFFEELRWLEYGARMRLQKRNICSGGDSTGDDLFKKSLIGGRKSTLASQEYYPKGEELNGCVIDSTHWRLTELAHKDRLSSLIMSGSSDCIHSTWVNGKQLIRKEEHPLESTINNRFRLALKQIYSKH